MRSRSILVVVLVLAVSLTLAVQFFPGASEREPGRTVSGGPADVDDAVARGSAAQVTLESGAVESSERTSVPTGATDTVPVAVASAPRGVLSGRCVDARGSAVAGARVFVARADRVQGVPLESVEPTRLKSAERFEARTDERGVFELSGVPAAPMRIAVRSPGRAPHDALIAVAAPRHDLGDVVLADSVVLRGHVLDRERRPVRGAALRRLRIDASPAEILGDAPDDVVATTDAAGAFVVDELAHGPWVLLIKAARHPDRLEKGETRTAGQVVDGLEFVLDDGATITGRVVDAPPELLADLWISAVPADGGSEGKVGAGEFADEKRFLVVPRRARCERDGSFSVGELTAGLRYRVAAQTGADAVLARAVTPWTAARAGDRNVELRYQPETALVFQVVDAVTSQPVTEMEVRVGKSFMLPLTDAKGQIRRIFTDGRARFENVLRRPLETHAELVIEARGYTTLRVGDLRPVAGRDLDLGVLRLERAQLVRVTVVDAATGGPVSGARVALTRPPASGSAAGAPSSSAAALHEGVTDAEGRVQLNSLPGGFAILTASHADYAPQQSAPLAQAHVGDRDERLELRRGGRVLLVVRDALGGSARGERIEHRSPAPGGSASAPRTALTDVKGELQFEHLPAGRHAFSASGVRSTTDANTVSVDVVEGGNHTATLVLPQRARVTGRVTEGGQALAGATLRFGSRLADASAIEAGDRLFARTNGNGEYALDAVELGVYRVSIVHPARAMAFESDARIEAPKCTFDVDVPRAAIEGRVVDEEGRPVAGVHVRVEGAVAARESGDVTGLTDADGKYVLAGLQPGVALVLVVTGGDYQPLRAEPVTVAVNEVKSGVDLRLAAGAALEVVVTSAAGGATSDLRVRATAALDGRTANATTNASGRAYFRGLRAGVWRVRVEREAAATTSAEVEVDLRLGGANKAALELR
jgi:protocatechuate 3,4-dioxygenase beta subunit